MTIETFGAPANMEGDFQTEIDISGKGMWDKETRAFLEANLSVHLVQLNLSTNHISYESAILLADLLQNPECSLQALAISSCRLTDKSASVILAALGKTRIIEFYADDNIFSEENCKALASVLAENPPLELISMCGSDMPAEGVIALAESLKGNTNLRVLRLESNSMFDFGASALGRALPHSALEEISIGDNEIWQDGMNVFLDGCARCQSLISVDVAYNILDPTKLKDCLMTDHIQELSISGCKITVQDAISVIEAVGKSHLRKLIIDGFNHQVLPVAWPKVRDEIWQNETCFARLLKSVELCTTLEDIRLGHLELEQVFALKDVLDKSGRHAYVSFHDFGRTWNCWVLEVPTGRFLSPVDKFEWRGGLNDENSVFIGEIIKNTVVGEDGVIKSISMNKCTIPDSLFSNMLESLRGYSFDSLDFSENELADGALVSLIGFLEEASVSEIVISNNKFSDQGCAEFIRQIVAHGAPIKTLKVNFSSPDMSEMSQHETAKSIGELLKANYDLTDLFLSGPVTANDAMTMFEHLSANSHIRTIEIESELTKNYCHPAPTIPEDVQGTFVNVVDVLYHALRDKKSQCKLQSFVFPLLTEIFIYNDDILAQWPDVLAKMEQNSAPKSGRRK